MAGKLGMVSLKPALPPAEASPDADFLAELDGRSSFVRNMREHRAAIYSDLGGEQNLSYMQRLLVDRVINLSGWIITQEPRLISSLKDDAELARVYLTACSTLDRLMRTLGTKRKARDLPSLRELLQQEPAE